jgi:D-alanyl-lipoteichoic acid acyltransferase DltB (MBOAT superfamily)
MRFKSLAFDVFLAAVASLYYALFVFLFPQLVAGPIVRARYF